MWDVNRLREIIMDCARIDGLPQPLDMPRGPEWAPDAAEEVGIHNMAVQVNKRVAEQHRDELTAILAAYPDEYGPLDKGPSYIAIGAAVGSQSGAFQLMAIGQVLGFWGIITPATLGFEGAEANEFAGRGFIMVSGFNPTVRE